MRERNLRQINEAVQLVNTGSSPIVLVCEHASRTIPAESHNLGLPEQHLDSHAAWDPGALGVATRLADRLDARLVAGAVSRLVYDLNRPPEAPDAITAQSELIAVPGNRDLDTAQRADRVARFYAPFQTALAQTIAAISQPVIVTIHSFTPIYHGQTREVQIGILHDTDRRLADAMLDIATRHTALHVGRNQPYGPEHGVTHTLRDHALKGGHLNVMIEIRNDLIARPEQQDDIADMLGAWIKAALKSATARGQMQCET